MAVTVSPVPVVTVFLLFALICNVSTSPFQKGPEIMVPKGEQEPAVIPTYGKTKQDQPIFRIPYQGKMNDNRVVKKLRRGFRGCPDPNAGDWTTCLFRGMR